MQKNKKRKRRSKEERIIAATLKLAKFNRWKNISMKYNVPIKIYGLDSIPTFKILSDNYAKYKTLITQEMLKKIY